MSQNGQTSKRSDEIRREIEETRHQMDQTIDALASRFKGRHLADELIGVFRAHASGEKMEKIKQSVTQTTDSAVNTIVKSVKSNPWPALLIGAGVAWMVYSARRSSRDDEYLESPYEDELSDEPGYELSGGGYSTVSEEYEPMGEAEGAASGLSEKLSNAKDQLQEKAADLKERMRQGADSVRQRASELGSRVQERSRELYEKSRERVANTVEEHPLGVGLGCLAVGVAIGLAIPTPNKVNELVGPGVDRLRDRAREAGRDLANRGRSVVRAATQAAKQEADSQGLSPEALRQKAAAVAQRTKDAATDQAQQQGLVTSPSPLGSGSQSVPTSQVS